MAPKICTLSNQSSSKVCRLPGYQSNSRDEAEKKDEKGEAGVWSQSRDSDECGADNLCGQTTHDLPRLF